MNELTIEQIEKMSCAAREESLRIGTGVTIAIADRGGALMYLQRFPGAILPSIEIAQNKAYTSAVLGMSTAEFGKIAQPGGSAFGINVTVPKLIIFGGGLPIIKDGTVIGGIGISGASAEEDEQIANFALSVL